MKRLYAEDMQYNNYDRDDYEALSKNLYMHHNVYIDEYSKYVRSNEGAIC